jgi:hypothetical protein
VGRVLTLVRVMVVVLKRRFNLEGATVSGRIVSFTAMREYQMAHV